MVITRSKAQPRQPLGQVASPGADPPRRVSSLTQDISRQPSWQGGVVVDCGGSTGTVGGCSVSSAMGKKRPPAARTCRSDCKTCPALIHSHTIKSQTTGRLYNAVDVTDVNCKIQNYIYLLTCSSCLVQYVGESVVPLHKRMNIHRTSKTGCEISIDHYRNVCPGASFTIQILEMLPGNGYVNGKIDETMSRYRHEREDHWMKLLRTIYPYGLNDKTRSMNEDKPVGKLFPPLSRHGSRFVDQRNRNPRDPNQTLDIDTFFTKINEFDISVRANEFRKLLDSFRQKDLRRLAVEANLKLFSCSDQVKRWYEQLIDVFFTKIYTEEKKTRRKAPKHLLPIFFDNKGLEFIQLNKILKNPDVVSKLPQPLKTEDPPSVVYNLSRTIRNSIFNYKQTVNDIDVNDHLTYGTNLPSCDCSSSPFLDSDHGHIITGDLRIIENNHLRKLISKGPNYREPRPINLKKCRELIECGTDKCVDHFASNQNIGPETLIPWKNEILRKVDAKITSLKRKIKYHKSNPILKRPEIIAYLENLHKTFVLVPIDKAGNNVCIICKRFYVEVILKEIGVLGEGNTTYVRTDESKEHIVNENVQYSKRLNMAVQDTELDLPTMYWIPKKHKNPTGKRFIIASKHCSTKQISTAVSNAFKLIYKQVENFHKKAKFLSNYNKFWVLQNSTPVIDILNKINKKRNAKSISTFDFSTLYTKLPHNKLIKELSAVIDFAFEGGKCKFIEISKQGKASWKTKRTQGAVSFSRNSLKQAVKHLIQNCFFTVGNIVMRQAIGIPMGIDPAPFWANLFLYQYEERYMSDLIQSDRMKARHFHSTKRFIDDLCAINDGNLFGQIYQEIYPEELELKLEHSGLHASFLNLDITIREGEFVYKLFDKRDAFPFSIVRMPFIDSNIPQSIFYSSLVGEFLRVARSTLKLHDFLVKAKDLCKRMTNQGAKKYLAERNIRKIVSRHEDDFNRFQTPINELIQKLF